MLLGISEDIDRPRLIGGVRFDRTVLSFAVQALKGLQPSRLIEDNSLNLVEIPSSQLGLSSVGFSSPMMTELSESRLCKIFSAFSVGRIFRRSCFFSCMTEASLISPLSIADLLRDL